VLRSGTLRGSPALIISRIATPIIGYFALALLLSGLTWASALDHADLWLLDWEMKWLRAWRVTPASQDVVLIGIDNDTIRAYPEPLALWHQHIADLLTALVALRPTAVALDFVLPDRSYDTVVPGIDRELVRALVGASRAYPLVVGATLDAAGRRRPLLPQIEASLGPKGIGFILWPVDPDHAVRRFDEHLAQDSAGVPTLVGQLVRKLKRQPGAGILDYSIGSALDYIPVHSLVSAWQDGTIDTFRDRISDRIAIIGPVLDLEDREIQPVDLARWESGRADAPSVILYAQAFRSILGSGLIRPLPQTVSLSLALVLVLAWFHRVRPLATIVLFIAVVGALLACAMLLMDRGVHLNLAVALLGFALAIGSRGAYQAALSFAERRRLRAALSGYVSPLVAQDVLAGKLEAGFEGRRYRLCVMFVDMRDFTPRSERARPEQMIRLINDCFEQIVAAVHDAKGTVLQFMGDGMEAIFGAPNLLENPALAAFESVSEIFERMHRLNQTLEQKSIEPVRLGVGLNLGEALVGHVGARTRYGYLAVGDVVNVAARLETLTKEVGFPVVCSEAVAAAIKDKFKLVALGEKAIKGHSPLRVYGWSPPPLGDRAHVVA